MAELFSNYNSRAYLFALVDGHADPYYHHLKDGEYSVADVQRRLTPGRGLFAHEAGRHVPNHFLPAKGTDKERLEVLMTKLLRGFNLVGNPFVKITYSK